MQSNNTHGHVPYIIRCYFLKPSFFATDSLPTSSRLLSAPLVSSPFPLSSLHPSPLRSAASRLPLRAALASPGTPSPGASCR